MSVVLLILLSLCILFLAVATFYDKVSNSFFYILLVGKTIAVYSQPSLSHNQLSLHHELYNLDCKSHRIYPVILPKHQTRILVVPGSEHENAQCLMAATYKFLQGQAIDKIILICQADSILFHGVALPYAMDDSTLMYNLSTSVQALEILAGHELFSYYQAPFCSHHGISRQCKLINFYLKDIVIIPLIISDISRQDAGQIATVIAACCSSQSVIVFSADIACHQNVMQDAPLDQSRECRVYDQDKEKIQAIQSRSLQLQCAAFADAANSSTFAVLFELLNLPDFDCLESYFVGYNTSDAVDKMYDEKEKAWIEKLSVDKRMDNIETYGSFIFQQGQTSYTNHIGAYEQLELLKYARAGLASLFEPETFRLPCMISYEMAAYHGVFVSLYMMSDHGIILRGCMGKVQSKLPLYEMVYQMSRQAGYKDVRFYPLCHKDLNSTIVSLSVITDFKKISDYNEINALDGIMLQYDDKLAISLPSIRQAKNWNYQSVLIDLSHQIGLHALIWKKPRAKIFTFQSLVFQEE